MKSLVIVLLFLAVLALSLLLGPGLSFGESFRLWLDYLSGGQIDQLQAALLEYRFWRAMTALLIGAALAVAGMILQAVLANPLSDPYILGISSGAGAGVALAALLGLPVAFSAIGISGNLVAGLLGAGIAISIVIAFAGRMRASMAGSLVIVGVMVGSFLSSVALLALSMAPGREQGAVLLWMLGDLASPRHGPAQTAVLAASVLVVALITVWRRRELDLLLTGEESAFVAGANVVRWRIFFIMLAALVTTSAVVIAGTIGFVGLFVPHLARLWLGASHGRLTSGVLILGALTVLTADTLSRTLVFTLNLPALPCGVVTALIGAPYFLFVLRRKIWQS